MSYRFVVCIAPALLGLTMAPTFAADASPANAQEVLKRAKRIVFLGDSITDAGHYISLLECQLRGRGAPVPTMINLGLPSETCSGLSEPDHPFPRPNVHERLQRVFEKTQPDLVVACYGMNCAIYHPFAEDRFAAFQQGIRKLIKVAKQHGTPIILMTPPSFDPQPFQRAGKLRPASAEKFAWFGIYAGYDKVIARYARWMLAQRKDVLQVIDLHAPMADHLRKQRKKDPDYALSKDGVHINHQGHVILAQAIAKSWGLPWEEIDPQQEKLVEKKMKLLHAAWLSHVGHKRPGVKAGLPLGEAKQQAARIEAQLAEAE